ncbi:MAG: DNA polymerase III subunit gamma/tau [Zoogloeaceae bacterium]|nr:DNA polymerase III subunit gamma/tau [Zoogloeaceae bacterium]
MSYQVLARKWRPKSFESLVGQEHVVRALSHALTEKRLHHAYLFTGTRGVGKTTIARILAKSLNCELGVSANPCRQCSACCEIDSGRFVDLLEVDAATNTRVDEMRQLLENAVYAPTRGRYKVYVIDEVHMLSNSAFNAMLKTLEEPPEHVKFILATTDPQKLPVTVLSRCLQFNLKQMSPPSISAHLARILESEGISFETAALQLVSRSAAGSMRDALSLLDQAIAHGSGSVQECQVREMLGTVDLDYLFDLLEALLGGEAATLLKVADDMAIRSLSFSAALQELATLLTRIQVAQLAPDALPEDEPERGRLLALAARMDIEFVHLSYQIVVHGRQELALAPDEFAGFVMTLLRLLAFCPESTGSSVKALGSPRATANVRTVPLVRPPEVSYKAIDVSLVEARVDEPVSVPVRESGSGAQKPSHSSISSIGIDWHEILGVLKLTGMARELAQHCEFCKLEEGVVYLRLSPVHRHLQMKPAQDKLQQALSTHFHCPLLLRIELADTVAATPAATAQKARAEQQENAVAAIEGDAFVCDIIEMFDAQLIESSIKPI